MHIGGSVLLVSSDGIKYTVVNRFGIFNFDDLVLTKINQTFGSQ